MMDDGVSRLRNRNSRAGEEAEHFVELGDRLINLILIFLNAPHAGLFLKSVMTIT